MCDNSWARTPSNSCLVNFSIAPSVTQITACFGSRPEANALICWLCMTYSFGFGNPEAKQSPSTMLWYCRYSGPDAFFAFDAAIARSADL